MTTGRRAVFALFTAAVLAACSSGGSGSRAARQPSAPTSGVIALRQHSVVALDDDGAVTGEVESTLDIDGNVEAITRLSDGTLVYTDCCDDYHTPKGGVLGAAILNLRAFKNPEFHTTGIAFGASSDRTKLATLDNITGAVSIYDVESKTTRRVETQFAKEAPWLSTGPGAIAWTDDDATLTMVDPNGGLVVIDAHTGKTRQEITAPKRATFRWPMALPDHHVAAVVPTLNGPSKLVAVDLRTSVQQQLGTLQVKPGALPVSQAASFATATRDHRAVLFIGDEQKLYRFDLATHASAPFGSERLFSWVDA